MANPLFNAVYYLTQNPDVFAAGYTVDTAYDHYTQFGADEAYVAGGSVRAPNPWFDAKYYLTQNTDLIAGGVTPETALDHFLAYGATEGRAPDAAVAANPITEAGLLAYAKANPDLLTAFGIEEDAAELTDTQKNDLTLQFYTYGYNESRPAAPTVVDVPAADANPGQTFTLTTAIDNITGTSGDDTFLGDNTSSNPADTLDGGAGNDTLKLYSTNTLPNISNIENIYVNNGGGNISVANIAGVETLTADADGALRTFTVAQGQSVKLMNNTVGGTVSGNTVASLDLTLQNVRGGTVDLTSTALGTLNLTSSGSGARNATTFDNTGAVLRTLNVDGNQALTLTPGLVPAALNLRTVDASKMTAGGLNIDLAANAQNLTVTGSGFNDRVALTNINQLTSADKIDLGEGKDTFALGTGTAWTAAGALGAANVALIESVKNFEVFEMTALSVSALDASLLSATEYVFSGDATTAGAGAPTNLVITKATSADTFVISASRDGLAGTAVSIQGEIASQTANVTLTGGVTVTGADTAIGDSALTTSTGINKLVINSTTAGTTAVTNSITNAATTTATHVIDNTEAQDVVITGASNLTVGVGASGATFTNTVNLDASAFTGNLVIGGSNSTLSGDIIKLGSGNDTLTASQGADVITLGAGNDTVVYTDATQSLTGGLADSAAILATIDKIQDWGNGADRIDFSGFSGGNSVYKSLTTTQLANIKAEGSLADALTTLNAITAVNDVAAFQWGGNTYVFADETVGAAAATDILIQLVGEHTLTAESFVL